MPVRKNTAWRGNEHTSVSRCSRGAHATGDMTSSRTLKPQAGPRGVGVGGQLALPDVVGVRSRKRGSGAACSGPVTFPGRRYRRDSRCGHLLPLGAAAPRSTAH